jgi:hypothetical protein
MYAHGRDTAPVYSLGGAIGVLLYGILTCDMCVDAFVQMWLQKLTRFVAWLQKPEDLHVTGALQGQGNKAHPGVRDDRQRRCDNRSDSWFIEVHGHDEMNRRSSSNSALHTAASPHVRFSDRRWSAQSRGSQGDGASAVVEDDTIEQEIDEIKRYEVTQTSVAFM